MWKIGSKLWERFRHSLQNLSKENKMCLIFTYSIISAVFHQFHEIVASDNSRRDNIHETHFGVVDLEIEKETGLSLRFTFTYLNVI